MMVGVDDEVAAALQERWSTEIERVAVGSSWVEQSLEPVVAVAATDPDLRGLFPFTSMNRLGFSRCSAYPYTLDCPCISADRGRYVVLSTWAVGDEPAPVLAETGDPMAAVAVVVAHLPADRGVWIGSTG